MSAWLSAFDYAMSFAVDADGSIGRKLGATAVLPQTIVLDRDGVVIYNRSGALTEEALEALYVEASGG